MTADRFAVYLLRDDETKIRLLTVALDTGGYEYILTSNESGAWRPYDPNTHDHLHDVVIKHQLMTGLLTTALASGQRPTMIAMEGMDEMPVYAVHESASSPAAMLLALCQRTPQAVAS